MSQPSPMTSLTCRRRRSPVQPWKPRIIAVQRNPFAARLDGKRREPSIGHARSSRIRLDAKPLEDIPVSLARFDDLTVGLAENVFAESECFLECACCSIGSGICGYSNHRTQRQTRNSETRIASHDSIEPRAADCVLWNALAKGVDENVDVRQNHLKPRFMRSTYSKSSIS